MSDIWDDDMDQGAPPPITNSSQINGFCVGRGRGFGNISQMSSALPTVGSQSTKYNNEPEDSGWQDEDTGWNENSGNQNTNKSDSWKNNNDSWGGSNNYNSRSDRVGGNDRNIYGRSFQNSGFRKRGSSNAGGNRNRSCHKCGEEGHMARDCPSASDSRRSNSCFKCGEEGHMSRDCPKSSGDNRSKGCFKCGEEGHMSRDCPNSTNDNRSKSCFKCGEEGHMSRDCPNSTNDSRSKNCFKCNEEGHMSRDCPNSTNDSRGKGCFKCHEEGHMARDCPNSDESKEREDGKPPAQTYIPPEPSNDADTVFASVPAGINFLKYDSIPVDVSGTRAPPHIDSFETSKLNQHLIKNIKRSGYDVPTPIQKYAIPIVREGRDLMACAQTGSGKTAAFLLPIIHNMIVDSNLANNIDKEQQEPLALILAPTRELAIQIMSEARKFSYDSIIRAEVVYGGTSTSYQSSRLRKGVHILVATPGRLNDFVERGKVSLSKLKYFVLDEADRMLDMGFMPAVDKMVAKMPPKGERQTLMFSATFASEIQKKAAEFLEDYIFLTVGTVGGANTDVEQTFFQLSQYEKRDKLLEILEQSGTDRVLVFVEQKRTADFLASFTSQKGFPTTSIHGDRLQREREEALRDFKAGNMYVLVATAVAARGLDINGVCHVINYDLPQCADEYVHRIGRTGRVGNPGKATSFYDPNSDQAIAEPLKRILADANQVIPDWLLEEASKSSGAGFSQYSRGNFGGRDVRNQGRFKSNNTAQSANDAWDNSATPSYDQPVASDECWD